MASQAARPEKENKMRRDDDNDNQEEEKEYIVEAIRKWRYDYERDRREYFVKWADYKESENTWEPEDCLHCPFILEEFKQSLSEEERLRIQCNNRDELNGFQRHADYRGCVGTDKPRESDNEGLDEKDKEKFYCQLLFQDNQDAVEEIDIKEFAKANQEDALKFIEQRLFRAKY